MVTVLGSQFTFVRHSPKIFQFMMTTYFPEDIPRNKASYMSHILCNGFLPILNPEMGYVEIGTPSLEAGS
ncbi:MAG: hypothetical protein HY364_00940 [Candidatus Aenigmarchaeota archaeon]|nr:hypothetical protein [Candidatus Aenigmarchaeota archaeon]